MNKDQLSTSVSSLLELDNISVNPSYSASEEESERVGMEELDTELDGEGKKKKRQRKRRRKKGDYLENEDSCAEFDLKDGGSVQGQQSDQTGESGLAVQKGVKGGRDPSPGKSSRGLMVRKPESGRFRPKLGGGSSPLGTKLRDDSRQKGKFPSTFPRDGQKGVGDGSLVTKMRRGSATAIPQEHSGSNQGGLERQDSSGLENYMRHGSTDSGPGETPTYTQGKKEASSKDRQKKGKNGGKEKKQGKKEAAGQANESASTTPKRQPFKHFEKHWTEEDVSRAIKQEKVIKGVLRINPKNFEEAYIDSPDGGTDIFINGVHARNRALHGDVVAVQILSGQIIMTPKSQKTSTPRKLLANQPVIAVSESPDRPGSATPGSSTPKKVGGRYFFGSQGDFDTSSLNEMELSDNLNSLHLNDSEAAFGFADVSATSGEEQDKVGDLSRREWSDARSEVSSSSEVVEDTPHTSSHLRGSSTSTGGGTPQKLGLSSRNDPRMQPKTGRVVYICEYKHSRAASGFLKPASGANSPDVLFAPTDHRVPRIHIPKKDCPPNFLQRPQDYANTLFIAHIIDWPPQSPFAKGHLYHSLGQVGDVEAETTAMLIEHGIDYSDFSAEVLEDLPKERPWTIPPDELTQRRDFRSECIFTIDPTTARDLDDALHCKPLGDGIYEVGVHIADVSYFVKEDTALDKVASHRATSVYLVQKVIPMLPRLLCEELCSLNPDEERLTMSFVWKMTEEGEILQEWCGRTVIRSCSKLSYLHAQDIIENWLDREGDIVLPVITNGFGPDNVAQGVLCLHKIAVNLRKKRFEDGALRLDQVKLQYSLSESGIPIGYSVYQQRDSNRLVEEFMLLANMAAAHRIYKAEPQRALLRRHPPPKDKMMDDMATLCEGLGLDIDGSSAGKLQASLSRYCTSDEHSRCLLKVLTVLYSKPMKKALYFCCASLEDEELYCHYALNVPLYTHFTSPIRRYPDILVHRMLASSLGCGPVMERCPDRLQRQAIRCNEAKDAAKEVSDKSSELFFCLFIKECGPLVEKAMVMGVLDRSFDVLILNLGQVKRVYCNALPLKSFQATQVPTTKYYELILQWEDERGSKGMTQVIKMFSLVTVEIMAEKTPIKYKAILKRPDHAT
ncbi:DIS3-like exonuclease 2 [Diadema antillarum]|uniref:DIS3-like exonuclease 2 n=1 Tax=Diadema antillarum TaxID=105358 RepID=UPI003A8C2A50